MWFGGLLPGRAGGASHASHIVLGHAAKARGRQGEGASRGKGHFEVKRARLGIGARVQDMRPAAATHCQAALPRPWPRPHHCSRPQPPCTPSPPPGALCCAMPCQAVPDPTGREDLVAHLRVRLLADTARRLGASKLVRGDCATTFAKRIISESAKAGCPGGAGAGAAAPGRGDGAMGFRPLHSASTAVSRGEATRGTGSRRLPWEGPLGTTCNVGVGVSFPQHRAQPANAWLTAQLIACKCPRPPCPGACACAPRAAARPRRRQ